MSISEELSYSQSVVLDSFVTIKQLFEQAPKVHIEPQHITILQRFLQKHLEAKLFWL